VDRLPELLDPEADELASVVDMPSTAAHCARSSYHLRYFCTDDVLHAQTQGQHRATEVVELERTLLELYADPALDHKPELLERRGGAYYSEAAAALVTSLLTGDGAHHYVDVRNQGTIAGLPDEAVVEVPATVDCDGAHPERVAPLPPEQLGLVRAVTAYEVLTIAAARTRDRSTALRALLATRWSAVGIAVPAGRPARGEPALPAGVRRRCPWLSMCSRWTAELNLRSWWPRPRRLLARTLGRVKSPLRDLPAGVTTRVPCG
jgi:hypothetical protein